MEDALSLHKYNVVDGFSGGAIAFWNPTKEFKRELSPEECVLYKLHGSIDWVNDVEFGLIRVRYGTKYLSDTSDIMIYPQATKYIETQKDPFSSLFSGLRESLKSPDDNVLITCGYSFGDEHINTEIETVLKIKNNRTNVIIFFKEAPSKDATVHKVIDSWLIDNRFGKRIFVAGEKGIYYNSLTPILKDDRAPITWWQFSGLTDFLKTGEV